MNLYAIEIKKIILGSIYNNHVGKTDSILDIINQLNNFSNTSTFNYSLEAAEFIVAYLHLGFSYLEHKAVFDNTLRNAGYSEEEICTFQKMNTIVPLNKANLRILIGRWPASPYNSHTISAAINDIILRVKQNDFGCYKYYTAKKDGCYTALYILTITEDCVIFNDVFNNKFYSLEKKETVKENTPSP